MYKILKVIKNIACANNSVTDNFETKNKTKKMKKSILLIQLIIPFFLIGQSTQDSLVNEGVRLHDSGNYEEAIKKYEEALEHDKESSLVLYELGYTNYVMGDYKKAIKYLDKVIKNKEGYLREAYTAKGSSLDNMGKSKAAIKTYEEAIKEFPEDYLLYFNLGLTRFNQGMIKESEEDIKQGISLNPAHTTSNYLLGIIKMEQGRRIESILAFHFFLLLEPDTKRSQEALIRLESLMYQGITKKDEKNIEINLLSLGEEDDFSSANLMLSLLGASNMTEENQNKSKQKLFYENTESLFSVLKEQKEGKTGLWWELYIEFYSSLLESDHMEAYCYFISQQKGEEEQKWISENGDKMDKFYKWLQE